MSSYLKTTVSASVLLAAASAAHAQTTATANTKTSDVGVEQVVVTAERRDSTTLKTPISMVALSGDQLKKQGLDKISDLQQAVPSLSIATAGSFNYVNIRGIGNAVSLAGTVTGVAIFQDNLFEPDATGLGTGFFDIKNVEVLRGPQSTFVGQSSTGGALLIESRDPDLAGFGGFAEVEYGSYSHVMATAAVNIPISDTLALRVAAMDNQRDSYYTNLGSHKQPGNVNDQGVRLSLLWQPTDALKMLFKAELTWTDNDGNPNAPIENTYIDPITNTPTHATFWFASTHKPYVIDYNYTGTYVKERHQRYSLDANYTFGNGVVLRSITGYQDSSIVESDDGDGTYLPIITLGDAIKPKHYYSEDLMVISPEDWRFNWILGASYFYRTNLNLTYVSGAEVADNPISARRLAAYAQAGYKITDDLQLQAGLRLNNDRNTDDNKIAGLEGTYTGNNVTGKVDLNWNVSPNQLFYAFYARGYKSGGVNVGQPDFKPETVDDYEIGWKALLGDNFHVELGGYYMNFRDMQVQSVDLATGANNAVGNLKGASTIKGIDASATADLGQFEINVGANYNKSVLGSSTLVALYALPTSASNTPQCTVVAGACSGAGFNYQPYMVNVDGSENPYSPELTFNAGVSYTFDLGDESTLVPAIHFTHTDKQYGSVFQADNYYLMGQRNLWDASLTYSIDQWTAEVYAKNLTNQTYIQGIFQGPTGLSAYYGAPREFGGNIRYSF